MSPTEPDKDCQSSIATDNPTAESAPITKALRGASRAASHPTGTNMTMLPMTFNRPSSQWPTVSPRRGGRRPSPLRRERTRATNRRGDLRTDSGPSGELRQSRFPIPSGYPASTSFDPAHRGAAPTIAFRSSNRHNNGPTARAVRVAPPSTRSTRSTRSSHASNRYRSATRWWGLGRVDFEVDSASESCSRIWLPC